MLPPTPHNIDKVTACTVWLLISLAVVCDCVYDYACIIHVQVSGAYGWWFKGQADRQTSRQRQYSTLHTVDMPVLCLYYNVYVCVWILACVLCKHMDADLTVKPTAGHTDTHLKTFLTLYTCTNHVSLYVSATICSNELIIGSKI